jgi:glycosyl hydrolase family 39 (putative alpha-L-iduronidase)
MNRISFLVAIMALIISGCGTAAPTTPEPEIAISSPTATVTVPPTATSFPTSTPIPTAVPGALYVDPATSLGPISPLIYGSNYGPWLVVSLDMLPAAYDSGIKILRFPAGAWGDHNDVQGSQIDQFMDFANKVGATLLFSVRLLDGNPAQAAALVQYVNIDRKYNIQYWNIGNEPTLYNGELQTRGQTYEVDRFNKEWRTFAEAMKAVDPTIKLVGPEINQFSYSTEPGATTNFSARDEEWLVEFLKANGDLVDVVSFHRYPFPASRTSGPPTIADLRHNAQEWDKIIIHARELIHQYTGRDLPIAVTEFNSSYDKSIGREGTPDSHFNAIWMADVLGKMIRNGILIANEWALTAKGGSGGSGLVSAYDVYPAYYTYQMYKKFGNELLYSSSDDPDVSIYAARRDDGTVTIMIINLSDEEKAKAILIGDQTEIQAEVWLFDEEHKAESMGTVQLDGQIDLPPHSVTLLIQ